MDKQTRQALEELATFLKLLEQCETRVLRIPNHFKHLYLSIPLEFTTGLRITRAGIEAFTQQLLEFQNLSVSKGKFPLLKKSKRS